MYFAEIIFFCQQEALRRMGLVDRVTPSKEKRPTNNPAANNVTKVGSGFVLTSSGLADRDGVVSDDPMVQQIRNLRGFIAEAKRLGRYDEVAALEDNLRELQVSAESVPFHNHNECHVYI